MFECQEEKRTVSKLALPGWLVSPAALWYTLLCGGYRKAARTEGTFLPAVSEI